VDDGGGPASVPPIPAPPPPETMPSVRDEGGYNQGWSGGGSTTLRSDRRCDLMITKMAVDPSRSVLEIGCGRGELARRLAGTTGMAVLGIDRSPGFVAEARQNATEPTVRFEAADFTQPGELAGAPFDYVVGNGILHHLYHSLPRSLEAMRALLAERGRLIFLEPNLHNPYVYLIFSRPRLRRMAKLEPDEMAFTRRFITSALDAAGFVDIEVSYRDFLVPGTPDRLARAVVAAGDVAERTRGLKHLAQALVIVADRP